MYKMSSHPQKNQKMCKSPSKTMAAYKDIQKSPKHQELQVNYEQLNTNCTMVGSNNLNLVMPQIKVCTTTKPKQNHASEIIKKPQSPRNMETFVHNTLITNNQKFQNNLTSFNQVSPQIAISGATFNNKFDFQQRNNLLPINKSPVPNFTSVSSVQTSGNVVINNGICNMSSPSSYSNPSPSNNYPSNAVSPYNVQNSSPANSISSISSGVQGIKSPVASPQNIRPPTPQPILPQAFQQIPVMTSGQNLVQIIQASNTQQSFQNPVITRQTIIAPQQQNVQNSPPVIKIKPPLNILPKPPASTTPSKTVTRTQTQPTPIQSPSQQIVLPNQTILPTAQPAGTLVLNQMPLIVQQNTAQGVQLILRPGTPNSAQIAGKIQPQNLILQQGPTQQPTVLIQHGNRNQTTIQQPQQLVRVLTANGMIQGLAPTYIAMNNQQINLQQIAQAQAQPQQQCAPNTQLSNQKGPQINLPQGIINTCIPTSVTSVVTNIPNVNIATVTSSIEQLPPPKRKPKKKKKPAKEIPKLDLANIMKLSGIGDDDDVHFESDTSESENKILTQPNNQMQKIEVNTSTPTTPEIDNQFPKRIGNIHISAVTQDISKISQNTTQTNAILEKTFMQTSQISVQQSLSDINAINQNLTQIGILNQTNQAQNFLNNISNSSVNIAQSSSQNIITQDGQNLATFLQALNQNQSFINGQSISQNVIPVSSIPSLTTIASSGQNLTNTSSYQKINLPTQPTVSISNLCNVTAQNVTQTISDLPKIQNNQSQMVNPPRSNPGHILTTQTIQNLSGNNQNIINHQLNNQNVVSGIANFNIPNITNQNFQVQNFGGQNLILNQGTNTIIAPNIPNFSGNITINNGLIPNANLTLGNNIVPNFLPNLTVQQDSLMGQNSGGNVVQRATGGFKLALSEDGRLILQHDPNLNQDIQSQLLLQSIFGINLQGGNLVLSSVNNQGVQPAPQAPQQIPQNNPPQISQNNPPQINLGNLHSKPIAVVEPKKQEVSTKTTNIIQNSISSIRQDQSGGNEPPGPQNNNQNGPNGPNNFSYIVNLTPEQLETLKRNGQLTVNGQTIFMHRPNNKNETPDKVKSSPKGNKNVKKKLPLIENKGTLMKTINPENVNIKNVMNEKTVTVSSVATQINNTTNANLITALQTPIKPTQQIQNVTNQNPSSDFENFPQNVVCVQPNNSKLLMQPEPIQKEIKIEEKFTVNEKKIESDSDVNVNVEQFLTNLNINPQNLGQLISQKLPGIDHKIVNISQGSTAGHIVAKIDISSENMKQILSNQHQQNQGTESNIVMPPLVSMKTEPTDQTRDSNQIFAQENIQIQPQLQPQLQPQPPMIITNPNNVAPPNEIPSNNSATSDGQNNRTNNTVYQRIQTIQLTPQKQQLLRSVQLQIQTLTAKLQQKNEKGETSKGDGTNMPETEIHRTLKLLYVEQQKILATGKVIPTIQPPVATINCNIESVPTQTIPVTTASKNSNTYLTSLLQQPVVSHNQKVYYHHGNQIITINSNLPNQTTTSTAINQPPLNQTQNQNQIKVKKLPSPTVIQPQFLSPKEKLQVSISNQNLTEPNQKTHSPNVILLSPKQNKVTTNACPATIPQTIAITAPTKPLISKAQLIEQQMTTDQNGAQNPDISTPFLNKADACKRLVRYHCYNQPVLSQKDLDKADEIFELTARHFIEKFRHMVNKYKYLLLKESMREVQTSELMMIDRMFLAEEQQSLLKAQADLKIQNDIENSLQEMYGEPDEDIKPPLGAPFGGHNEPHVAPKQETLTYQKVDVEDFVVKTEAPEKEFETNDFNIKCGLNYFSDDNDNEDSCDSNFQTEITPKFEEYSQKMERQREPKMEKGSENQNQSYNTTKIIGNFEIEINNKSCANQESFTKNFRQKIIENNEKMGHAENFDKVPENSEEYDEWLCIQKELGYFPDNQNCEKVSSKNEKVGLDLGSELKKTDGLINKPQKRSTPSSNSLETLKKFRVDKHNSKVKKSGSIIGEVKFEVRIEHKKVFPTTDKKDSVSASKRPHENCFKNEPDFTQDRKRACVNVTQNFNQINIKTEPVSVENQISEINQPEDIFDRSIDEQVQSAIDSILNLQQITMGSTGEKSENVSKESVKNDFNNKIGNENSENLNLDEAVKSILS